MSILTTAKYLELSWEVGWWDEVEILIPSFGLNLSGENGKRVLNTLVPVDHYLCGVNQRYDEVC